MPAERAAAAVVDHHRGPVEVIAGCRVIAVLRSQSAERFAEVSDVLIAAGICAVEFTLTTPGAVQALGKYVRTAPPEACIGAGTVLTAADARQCAEAGAAFLVSPALVPEVVEEGGRLGIPVIAGALTPTEILQAQRLGATAVKVFPAALGGPQYIRLVRDPLPAVRLVPTGGIRMENAADYLAAGSFALGTGSNLTGSVFTDGDLEVLRERAEQLMAAVSSAPPGPVT
jgi:2-dehydro-3-deoxyphosphogluconate aldolase/(4S)-4-hydroxy-2-oxoglutarate aldolase